jgi:hypothetical protein
MVLEKKGLYSLLDDVEVVERRFLYYSDVTVGESYWCYLPYTKEGDFKVPCKYYLKLGVVVYKDPYNCLLSCASSLYYVTYDCLYRDYVEACYYVNEQLGDYCGLYRVRDIR